MPEQILFSFAEYWWAYGAFLLFVLIMLAVDLGIFNRTPHKVGFKEATIWSLVWVLLALAFNWGLYQYALSDPNLSAKASELGFEFLTGYILEKSLSVDNIFVFVLVFSYFSIPEKYQHRVLFYGILGALIFRAIFVGMGSYIITHFRPVLGVFAIFLIFTGIKMLFVRNKDVDPEKNVLIRLFRRFVPVTHEIEGQSFFIRRNKAWFATPLFIALLFLEATDIVFAVDSVPAIFAVTEEPFIVFTSNIFAILGLRSMYFMLAGVIDKFHLLKVGLSLVLVFVGIKMGVNFIYDFHVPTAYSLGTIVGIIAVSVIASLLFPKRDKSIVDGTSKGDGVN
jgi:tellurite resistance protein TerC